MTEHRTDEADLGTADRQTAWRGDRKGPRSVANLPTPPRRKNEPEAAYSRRAHRWRVFLADEPRPDLWYTPEDEVREYREWLTSAVQGAASGRSAVNQ